MLVIYLVSILLSLIMKSSISLKMRLFIVIYGLELQANLTAKMIGDAFWTND